MRFNEYFPGSEQGLLTHFDEMLHELLDDSPGRDDAVVLLNQLRDKSSGGYFHYLHSLRVAVISALTAKMVFMSPVPAFYAGMLHDVGKSRLPDRLLSPPDGVWTAEMAKEMEEHVRHTHEMLRELFYFIACIVARHHRYQPHGYPDELPSDLQRFSRFSEALIPIYSVILSIADVYDAMHRISGDTALTGVEIKTKMIEEHPKEWRDVIKGMYECRILTTWSTLSPHEELWIPPKLDDIITARTL